MKGHILPATMGGIASCVLSGVVACSSVHAENWPVMREVFWLLDKNDHRGCLKILEPEITGSLKENGVAQSAYGLLLTDFHRYDEAREHLMYGLKLSPHGYFSVDAQQTLDHLAEVEARYQSTRAEGAGSVGLVTNGNLIRRVISGSPAAMAHMIAGDVILTIDSRAVNSNVTAITKSLRGAVGSTVTITFARAGKIYGCRLVRSDVDGPYYVPGSRRGDGIASNTKISNDNAAPASSSSIDESVISIYRRTNDSTEVYESVLRGLRYLPVSLRRQLFNEKLKIVVTPTMEEAAPNLTEPSGYYHDALGVYDPNIKTVYVAERCARGNGIPEHSPSVTDTLLHEIGHAFDDFNGTVNSESFLKAYKTDSQHISNSDRARYNYYTNGDNSTKELFAELFAIALLPRAEVLEDSRDLERVFPLSFGCIKKQILASY